VAREPIVRVPLHLTDARTRTFDQRLSLRFPWVARLSGRLIGCLPPGSRLRRAGFTRSARLGVEAYNRRDLDAVTIVFDPDLEYYPYREFVEAGLAEPCYHGPDGYKDYIAATYEVWGHEVRLEAPELIDLGDHVVLLADMPMRAQASGVALDQSYASIATLKDGRVIRQQDFLAQAEALEAVGLGVGSTASTQGESSGRLDT
jgi:ketosteroid isomerase-like protein